MICIDFYYRKIIFAFLANFHDIVWNDLVINLVRLFIEIYLTLSPLGGAESEKHKAESEGY
jgi:hypothetical protein